MQIPETVTKFASDTCDLITKLRASARKNVEAGYDQASYRDSQSFINASSQYIQARAEEVGKKLAELSRQPSKMLRLRDLEENFAFLDEWFSLFQNFAEQSQIYFWKHQDIDAQYRQTGMKGDYSINKQGLLQSLSHFYKNAYSSLSGLLGVLPSIIENLNVYGPEKDEFIGELKKRIIASDTLI